MPELECAVCKKDAKSRCGGCNTVYYCSQVCQKTDWKSHKLICAEKKKTVEKYNKLTHYVNDEMLKKIKTCSNCAGSLPVTESGRKMILCPTCHLEGYCSDTCFRLHEERHKRTCNFAKFQVVLTWKLAKDYYLSKPGTQDPEIIAALDNTISTIKLGERISDTFLLSNTIMSEYMKYIESNPAKKSEQKTTFMRLNKDYMEGRLKLEDIT
jgi:hypothetical protein